MKQRGQGDRPARCARGSPLGRCDTGLLRMRGVAVVQATPLLVVAIAANNTTVRGVSQVAIAMRGSVGPCSDVATALRGRRGWAWRSGATRSTRRRPDRPVADHALAIDVGTQSVRAILFDPQGNLVAMGRVPIEPYVSPQPGWAEQDPEVWWTAIGEACRRLWASAATAAQAAPDPIERRRRRPDDPARHARRRGRGRHAAPAGDRLARPAPDRGAASRSAGSWGAAFRLDRRPRDGRPLPGRRRGELDRAPRARGLEADPALRRPVVVADGAAHGRVGRLDRRARSATCRSTSSTAAGRAASTGSGRSRHSTGRGCRGSSRRRAGSAS